MSLKLPQLKPPVISAYLVEIQLLNERSELAVATVDSLRSKGNKVTAKLEHTWNLQAAIGERGGGEKSFLTIDVSLNVRVSDADTQLHLGLYECRGRVVFEIAGAIGEIESANIPAGAIEAELIEAADRVRARCNSNFRLMSLPVEVPSPRGFIVAQPAAAPSSHEASIGAGSSKTRKRKARK